MWTRSKRWMHLALYAGLVAGVAMFVGCGDGSDSSGGGDSGSSNSGNGGGDADSGNGGADNAGGDNAGGGDPNPGDGDNGGSTTGGGSVTIDHGSPEALFDSMLDAARAQDYKAIAECYAPSIQRDMAMGMITTAATADMNPVVNKADFLPVLERHGISETDLPALGPQLQSQSEALADGLADLTGFVGDMMSTLPDVAQGYTSTFGNTAAASTTLTDLEVDGDNASAQITAAGQASGDERRVSFVRIDGKWYVSG